MSERLRVLLVGRALTTGGAERQMIHIANGLAARGHQVRLSTFYAVNEFPDALDRDRVTWTALEKTSRWDVAGPIQRLRTLVRRWRPDAIYTFLTPANLLLTALRPVLPRHALVWGLRGADLDLSRYDWLSRLTIRLERRLAWVPDLIIANSEAGRRDALAHGFPGDRIRVVPNGIDTDAFSPVTADERRAARARMGLPRDALVVGLVARLDPMKDHETALRAMARVVRTRDAHLVLAGTGPAEFRRKLEMFADGLGLAGRAHWLGAAPEVRTVYAAIDVLCLPSAFGEGFPNVIGEAMACGVPCVATDVGDSRAVMGGFGVVVPPRDPAALADGLSRMADRAADPELGPLLRRRIVERYSLAAMIERTEDLLLAVHRTAKGRPQPPP